MSPITRNKIFTAMLCVYLSICALLLGKVMYVHLKPVSITSSDVPEVAVGALKSVQTSLSSRSPVPSAPAAILPAFGKPEPFRK